MLYKITEMLSTKPLDKEKASKLNYKTYSWLEGIGDSWVLPERMCPAFVKIVEFGFNFEKGKPEIQDYWVVISTNTHVPEGTIVTIERWFGI